MIKLLIIADDFTGALDTGVHLASCEIKVKVITNYIVDIEKYKNEVDVLVIDAETRHLVPQEAYEIVKNIVEVAVKIGVTNIYKKTDSGLRGNIGAEIAAVFDATSYKKLPFMPAFPEMERFTIGGIQYISGIPVAESVFGKEPFEPVKYSKVAEIIQEQSEIKTHEISLKDMQMIEEGIYIIDTQSQYELEVIGENLKNTNKLSITAGCAGFGKVLPKLLGWHRKEEIKLPSLNSKLLVVCGSVNPITLKQLDYAEKNGFERYRITPEQKLNTCSWENGVNDNLISKLKETLKKQDYMILDSNDLGDNNKTREYAEILNMDTEDMRVSISTAIGKIVNELVESPDVGTLLITGGDVLKQCMDFMEVYEMEPICEIFSGIVLSKFYKNDCLKYVISKSGGFGEKTVINDIAKAIEDRNIINN